MASTKIQVARRSELPTHAKKLQLGRKKKNTCCFRSGPKTTGRFARQPCENSQLRTPIQKKRSSERSHTSRQRSSLRSPNLENGGCVAPNLWCFEKSGVDTETKTQTHTFTRHIRTDTEGTRANAQRRELQTCLAPPLLVNAASRPHLTTDDEKCCQRQRRRSHSWTLRERAPDPLANDF